MEKCENCGATIGELEVPHIYENHIVCISCWKRLGPRATLRSSKFLPIIIAVVMIAAGIGLSIKFISQSIPRAVESQVPRPQGSLALSDQVQGLPAASQPATADPHDRPTDIVYLARIAGVPYLWALFGKDQKYQFADSSAAIKIVENDSSNLVVHEPDGTTRSYATEATALLTEPDLDGKEFMLQGDDKPIEIGDKDGADVVLLEHVYVNTVYNTIKTSDRQRAAAAFSEEYQGLLNGLDGVFRDTPVRYYAFGITYGVRDFSDDLSFGEGETLIAVIDKADYQRFKDGKITDQELFDRSAFYIEDGKNLLDLRKVALKLE